MAGIDPLAVVRERDWLAPNLPIVQLPPVSDSEYKAGMTAGSKWGCAAAAVIGAPLFFFLIIADALGDCAPDTACKKGFLPFVATPTIIVAAALFFTVRVIVNRFRRSQDGD